MTEAEARQLLAGNIYGMRDKEIYNGVFNSIITFFDYYKVTQSTLPVIENTITQAFTEKECTRLEFLLEDFINPELEEYFRGVADHIKELREAYDCLINLGYKVYRK